jgi:antitoxin component YwqK of YwqJK toxin-antitoxin module
MILFKILSIAIAGLSAPDSTIYIDFDKLDLNAYLKEGKPGIKIEKLDTKGAGKPDTYFVFEDQPDKKRELLMHLFDLNGNGKVDLAKHFSKGKLIKTEADLDLKEGVDVVTEYDPKTGEIIKKTQADGKTNIWRYWHEGKVRLKEMDRNSDKRPDVWVHYRNGKVVKTETDVDFDGKNIRIQNADQ